MKRAAMSNGQYSKLQALAITKGVSVKELIDVVVNEMSTPRSRRYKRILSQTEAFHGS